MVHQGSRREKAPLFTLNCALFDDESFLEKKLFGEEENLFHQKVITPGFFDLTKGGTLFIEQIDKIPLSIQDKIFQAITTKKYCRVGSSEHLELDVRFISESNLILKDETNQGTFLKSLYQTLSTLILEIPALRNRREDILPMATFFAKPQF